VVSDILAEELKRELMKGMVGIDDLRAMRGLELRPRRFEAGAERSVVFEKVWKALMRVGMDGKRIEDGSYIVGAEGRRGVVVWNQLLRLGCAVAELPWGSSEFVSPQPQRTS
jgi:hypothetical protein